MHVLLVEVRADDLRLSGETMSAETLETRVAVRLQDRPGQRVLVKPSPGVPLQRVVGVLDALAAVGAGNVSLVRDELR